ncbi:MAG: hypothetical protein AB7R55_20830 [Gemmatimonadales bacterium]
MAGELTLDRWLGDRLAETPEELAERTREFLAAAGAGPLPERLAAAGRLALARATERSAGRGGALDLLAADALVTLALAAQVETDPAELEALAARLRRCAGDDG